LGVLRVSTGAEAALEALYQHHHAEGWGHVLANR
jgi:hypothetical protein